MPYSPYEWNESIRQRNEFIEERLKEGSPVVALTYDNGILLLTLRGSQRKVYEIYDKLVFSAIGNQSDIESIRTGAIDIAHREGFNRSPDDVSIQRIVGFAISPSIKKVYADPFTAPVVIRAIFAELGKTAEEDQFFVVSYDGEFRNYPKMGVIAGTSFAEERMLKHLETETESGLPSLDQALRAALYAWGVGKKHTEPADEADEESISAGEGEKDVSSFIADLLKDDWQVEAAILERNTRRESRFRALNESDLKDALAKYK